jgi:hypothetical protein
MLSRLKQRAQQDDGLATEHAGAGRYSPRRAPVAQWIEQRFPERPGRASPEEAPRARAKRDLTSHASGFAEVGVVWRASAKGG